MYHASRLMILTAGPLFLAACGQNADTGAASSDKETTAVAAQIQTVSGEGTVTAIDDEAGTITIDHGPIPAANWPAMTMGFKADEALRASVESGDEVAFDLELKNGDGEVTRVDRKQ